MLPAQGTLPVQGTTPKVQGTTPQVQGTTLPVQGGVGVQGRPGRRR